MCECETYIFHAKYRHTTSSFSALLSAVFAESCVRSVKTPTLHYHVYICAASEWETSHARTHARTHARSHARTLTRVYILVHVVCTLFTDSDAITGEEEVAAASIEPVGACVGGRVLGQKGEVAAGANVSSPCLIRSSFNLIRSNLIASGQIQTRTQLITLPTLVSIRSDQVKSQSNMAAHPQPMTSPTPNLPLLEHPNRCPVFGEPGKERHGGEREEGREGGCARERGEREERKSQLTR